MQLLTRTALTGAVVLLGVSTETGVVMAQSVPSSAEASRVQDQIGSTLPPSKVEAPVKVEGNAPFTAPDGAEKILFTLSSVNIEGNTVYRQADLEKLYANMVGQKVSLANIYELAAQLTAKFRNDGYILTQVVVPPQTIAGGVVKLRVVEGSIDRIRIQGDNNNMRNDVIRLYAAQLKKKPVLNNRDLEKALLLINDLPGVTARGVLSPSNNVVGASDLTIIVSRDPFDAVIGMDNYGSRYLGRLEATAGTAVNNLLGMNERLSLNVAYAPSGQGLEPELTYGELGAMFPIGGYGTELEFNFGDTETHPGLFLKDLNVRGHSSYGGAKIVQPIVRTRDFNISTHLGVDVRNTKTKSDVDVTRIDNLTVARAGVHTDWIDTVLNAAVTNVDLELSQGLSAFGASDKGDANLSRPDADPRFTKLTGSVSRLERIVNNVNLKASLKGQISSSALLTAEEFGVGGAALGRGYDPSEIVGDDGIGGSLEVQWDRPYQISWLNDYTLYGFYDVGKVWNTDATTSSDKVNSLASAGVGIRATIVPGTDAGFMLAMPLTSKVAAENNSDIRPYFNISHKF